MRRLAFWVMVNLMLVSAVCWAAPKTTPQVVVPIPSEAQSPPPSPATTNPVQPPPPAAASVIVETNPAPKPQSMVEWIVANILPLVLSAMGIAISPQLLLILQKVLTFFGTRAEQELRAKLNDIVKNGIASASADGAQTQQDFFQRVLAYAQEHAKDTMSKLGVKPNSQQAVSAIKGIMDRILASGELPISLPVPSGDGSQDRIATLEKMVRDLVKVVGQGKVVPEIG